MSAVWEAEKDGIDETRNGKKKMRIAVSKRCVLAEELQEEKGRNREVLTLSSYSLLGVFFELVLYGMDDRITQNNKKQEQNLKNYKLIYNNDEINYNNIDFFLLHGGCGGKKEKLQK